MRLHSYKDNNRVWLDLDNFTFRCEEDGKQKYYRRENYKLIEIGLIHKPAMLIQEVFDKMIRAIDLTELNLHGRVRWLNDKEFESVNRNKYNVYWADEETYEDEDTNGVQKKIRHKAKPIAIAKWLMARIGFYPPIVLIVLFMNLVRFLLKPFSKEEKEEKEVLKKM